MYPTNEFYLQKAPNIVASHKCIQRMNELPVEGTKYCSKSQVLSSLMYSSKVQDYGRGSFKEKTILTKIQLFNLFR